MYEAFGISHGCSEFQASNMQSIFKVVLTVAHLLHIFEFSLDGSTVVLRWTC